MLSCLIFISHLIPKYFLKVLDSNAGQSLVLDPLNAGDGVAAGMPDRPARLILGRSHTESPHVVLAVLLLVVKAEGRLLVTLLLPGVLTARAKHTNQRVAEGFPEILIEVGVDKRIEGRIEIADPEKDFNDDVGTVAEVTAERDGHIPAEERQPAQHESSHNDAQRPGRLVLSSDLLQVFAVFADGRCVAARVVSTLVPTCVR